MKVIFMGTPEFAVPALNKLLDSKDHEVLAIFTAPPKPKNRGMNLTRSPVHQIAIDKGINVFTPSSLRTKEAWETIDKINADVIVVAAYGFIVPKNILESKKYGCLNIHPSKLPKYRGAAPLQWTIINGDKESAVCIMQMDEGLDTGEIILEQTFNIDDKVTYKNLHDLTSNLGADLLLKVLKNIENFPRIKQKSEQNIIYARKLKKEDGYIDFSEPAYKIDCKIRGMNPWPGTYFKLKDTVIKILEADYDMKDHNLKPGSIINNSLEIACKKGILKVKKLKLEGKKEMTAQEFLNGYRVCDKTKNMLR